MNRLHHVDPETSCALLLLKIADNKTDFQGTTSPNSCKAPSAITSKNRSGPNGRFGVHGKKLWALQLEELVDDFVNSAAPPNTVELVKQ